jgi:dipeptidyl aminopeptidase/acylaminoacyl peptidase
LWKCAKQVCSELWSAEGTRVIGGPAISRDGTSIAFAASQHDRTLLYVMQADGSNVRVLADSFHLQGNPAWAPDGQSLTIAAEDRGVPHLFKVPLDGSPPTAFVGEYSTDPAWSPNGSFLLYSGADVGTNFPLKAAHASGQPDASAEISLTRGARHVVFTPEGDQVLVLRGEIQHKNFALLNVQTGTERVITSLPADFDVRDFDLSSDGTEVVFERVQERSDIVLLELGKK